MTFEQEGDIFKIQAGSDRTFAVFGEDDELITEGEGTEDLYRLFVSNLGPTRSTRYPRNG